MLHAVIYEMNAPVSFDFTHVSGEYFILYTRLYEEKRPQGDYEPSRDSVSKAEFRLGDDGKVKELGMQLEAEMGDDKIWFTKVE